MMDRLTLDYTESGSLLHFDVIESDGTRFGVFSINKKYRPIADLIYNAVNAQSPPVAALPECKAGALQSLIAYREQMDADGIKVGVSREALDSVLDYLDALRAAASGLSAQVAELTMQIELCAKANVSYVQRADGLASENQRLKEKVTNLEYELAAEQAAYKIAEEDLRAYRMSNSRFGDGA